MARSILSIGRWVVLGAVLSTSLGACENLGLRAEPEEMTVEIEAVGTDNVTLVTSTNWVFIDDPACDPTIQNCDQILRIQSADTATFDAPYKQTFRFDDRYRYLVETYPTDSVSATLSLRILIDGQPWYSDSRPLEPPLPGVDRETLLFTYVWQEPRLRGT